MTTPLPKNSFKRKRGAPAHSSRAVRDTRSVTCPQFSVYDGRDRLGSFRRDGDRFAAFNRLGRCLGTFTTQGEAIAVVGREAAS
ncbi:MAG TPA: hypothetical protein VKB89_09300 [Xanthobacteraceae bacterium]|nr:hypothetical protein [Xanthobacteraceae bacterium]